MLSCCSTKEGGLVGWCFYCYVRLSALSWLALLLFLLRYFCNRFVSLSPSPYPNKFSTTTSPVYHFCCLYCRGILVRLFRLVSLIQVTKVYLVLGLIGLG
ncbi:hypothetical protein R6Q59_009049 [Mikania micrantha]